jgi:Cu+-exporting ATPase
LDAKHDQLPILPADTGQSAIDPVCGMSVAKSSAKHTFDHDGARYYFCCRSCQEKFAANPHAYLSSAPKQAHHDHASAAPATLARVGAEAIYICPMDPEVRQVGPGSCPKCGMALEPESPMPPGERVEYTCPMHP